jgi:hypothetical protein
MSRYWEIDQGKVDGSDFFRSLPTYFPDATSFFAEGTSISEGVIECYKKYFEGGAYLPGAQTIWPKSGKYRCKFSKELMEELAALSERHAEPELLDHLSLYKGKEPLLEWHDAFANIILVPRTVTEEVVRKFASHFGLGYKVA